MVIQYRSKKITKTTVSWCLTPLSTIFQSVLLEEETEGPGENHRPVASQ